MKNIWEIFRRDIKRIKNNVIAMIVIMGITVVPCLYAWFNIAASWDPYKNTGNLKVAVASVDKGHSLIGQGNHRRERQPHLPIAFQDGSAACRHDECGGGEQRD